tara:strand:+ start:109 stop:516 length:408 start_codon:yes stop_codon:yes gene_type:complete
MNKLAIFSFIFFLSVFIPSIVLVIGYILGIGGIGDHHESWLGDVWFFLTILIVNLVVFFFPVYYLQAISSFRKSQRVNELDFNKDETEPYFFDLSKFIHSLKRYYIWHYKDTIRDNKIRNKKKQLKEAEIVKNIQ